MNLRLFAIGAQKFLVALVAALSELAVALSDNKLTSSEEILIAIAFLGALGVYAKANKS